MILSQSALGSDFRLRSRTAVREPDIIASMSYRLLGRTGVRVSPAVSRDPEFRRAHARRGSRRIVDACLDAGINFIDTANIYHGGRSEEAVGQGARRAARSRRAGHQGALPDRGRARTTRATRGCTSCAPARTRCAACSTDYIDLYQVHRPSPEIPIEETLGALTDLVQGWQGALRRLLDASGMDGDGGAGGQRARSAWPATSANSRPTTCSIAASRTNCCRWPRATAWRSCRGRRSRRGCWPDATRRPTRRRPTRARRVQPDSIYSRRVTARGIEAGQRVCRARPRTGPARPGQLALLWCKDQPGITSPIVGPRTLEQIAGPAAGARAVAHRRAARGVRRDQPAGHRAS